tara:strand:- start:315 stop:479 length:165 start_codon:yes stop_codon:yes gene_type:complete
METPFTKKIGVWVKQIQELNKDGNIETTHPEIFAAFKNFTLKLDETVQNIKAIA